METKAAIEEIFREINATQQSEPEVDILVGRDNLGGFQDIEDLDMSKLRASVEDAEYQRDCLYNLGFELTYFKEMQVLCSDATIMVRRLVHNFEERMADTERQVWTDKHSLKPEFSFKGISVAGMYDIILLHDWYACNAPGKTYEEMGFTNKAQFLAFRKKCNQVSYNLRKNQYLKILAMERENLEERIQELKDQLDMDNDLKWHDKYGREAVKEDEKPWTIEDAKKKVATSTAFAKAEEFLDREFKKMAAKKPMPTSNEHGAIRAITKTDPNVGAGDYSPVVAEARFKKVKEMTKDYLVDLGIIKDGENIERLVAASKIANEGIDVRKEIEGLEKAKAELDDAISKMKEHKATLSGLLNRLYEAELKSNDLKQRNRNLFNACLTERNRKAKTKMLMEKMENEQKIQELDELVRSEKKKHFEDLGFLESLREGVDKCQAEYDRQVKEFKEKVGVNQDSIEQFVIKVYNKYQDDILEVD